MMASADVIYLLEGINTSTPAPSHACTTAFGTQLRREEQAKDTLLLIK
jgi:hypothetical protein